MVTKTGRISEATFETRRTARYFYAGDPSTARRLWFLCHGYGQSAKKLLEDSISCFSKDEFVVAPEGLSRFYLKGFSGDVGPSWMTKELRLSEIDDYVNYLNGLLDEFFKKFSHPPLIYLLGFSQGAATVSRWIASGRVPSRALILWSGLFPPDLPGTIPQGAGAFKIYLVIGKQDQFISMEQVSSQKQGLEEQGYNVELITFDGRHAIKPDVLLELKTRLYQE
ncbi:MAG: phospholipase [Candidatus Dadabacteria bacterium]|nr:MAG: phospholipase [Candidatus Dadabacteria bacterium]